jgi:peptidoglycan/xylan/chitin deacetylase (PgdA/CDA1 family)
MLTASGLANLCRPLTRNAGVVFMLHRFADPDRGVRGHEPASVRELLGYLRRSKYQLVDLASLMASLRGDAAPLHHAVAFTIDDGYLDHAAVACPLFAEFDCPVTTFVTTGFLDGTLWFWWDRIQFTFARAAARRLTLDLGDSTVSYDVRDPASREAAADDFTTRCKRLPDAEKIEAIHCLASEAEVEVPHQPPPAYAPMSWSQLRACERRGMTFGPHTVTHPILARTGDSQARTEIVESWARLQREAASPVPIFAYPNGQAGDFGEREFGILRSAGIRSGVTGISGFATPQRHRDPNGEFLVPRFPFPDELPYLIQQVSGLERLKFMLRGVD